MPYILDIVTPSKYPTIGLLYDAVKVGRCAHTITGRIYILRHPCMLGLLKIGFTSRTVRVRKTELEAPTGVPGPFVLVRQMPVHGIEVEREVHRRLRRWREVGNREFFRCSLLRAKLVVWATNRDYGRRIGQGGWNPLPLLVSTPHHERPRRVVPQLRHE